MQALRRPLSLLRATRITRTQAVCPAAARTFSSNSRRAQEQQSSRLGSQAQPDRPVSFYRAHGRAFAKVITLAFLTYQITYFLWLTLEAEDTKDQKNREIKSLEEEVRLLDEGRKAHKSGGG